MRRDTLARFIQGAVVAALPLVNAGCGSPVGPPGCGGKVTYIADGGVGDAGCQSVCHGGIALSCQQQQNSAGQPVTNCTVQQLCTGRRPEGLVAATATDAGALGRHFAEAAHLEAASVPAFRRLGRELRAHGAPRRLVDACRRAARDEIRHARGADRLAHRFGASRPPVRVRPLGDRPLRAIALENAREGCVRETFGALVATWQAATARDVEVRAHLQAIAGDETRHAELAWEIDRWIARRLSPSERAELTRARAAELQAIAAGVEAPVDAELARAAGWPPPVAARALYDAFAAEVARRQE